MATKRYGLYGEVTKDFLTWGGKILWHSDAGELGYLVPIGANPQEIPRHIPDDLMMHIRHHPQMSTVRWPLRKSDFRRS